MIIHYNNKTGKIMSVIKGRVHDPDRVVVMKFSGTDDKDITQYIIPTKPVYERVMTPVFETRDEGDRIVKVKIGERFEDKCVELLYDGPLADVALKSEQGGFGLLGLNLELVNGEVAGVQE